MKENKWTRGAIPAILLHISIGSVYAWSLFVEPISTYIGKSQRSVQFAFSLAIFFLGMSAAFGGRIVEKNIRRSSLISLFCFCGGLMFTALAIRIKSLVLLYAGYGVLMGIGLGIGYITPVKTLMLWFKENKGLATGISVCAFGFASSVASPIITFLLAKVDLITTFIILAGIYFLPILLCHFLLKKPEGWIEPQDSSSFKVSSMWKDKRFLAVWVIVFFNITCGLALISVASPILKEREINAKNIALIVSIMGIFNGAGRLVFSTVSDRLKKRSSIYVVIAGLSISTVALVIATKTSLFYVISLIAVSACYGAGFSCLPTLLSDIYGMDNISKIHGLSLTAWAVAGLVGNQISSFVYGRTGNYYAVYIVLLMLYVSELATVIYLRYLLRKENIG